MAKVPLRFSPYNSRIDSGSLLRSKAPGGGLHAESHLERCNARIEQSFVPPTLHLEGVHLLDQVELAALRRLRQVSILEVGNHVARG